MEHTDWDTVIFPTREREREREQNASEGWAQEVRQVEQCLGFKTWETSIKKLYWQTWKIMQKLCKSWVKVWYHCDGKKSCGIISESL